MNIALWIGQGLLAIMFLMAGSMKATRPKEQLAERMEWVNDFSASTIRLIGILEVLGAAGVVLPKATGILPWLTPTAAAGLALTMVGAALIHIRRNEYGNLVMNIVLLAMAAFVAYGRFVLLP